MKRFVREIVILLIQSAVFYLIPLFGMNENPMGMVLLIILLTFVLSLILGAVSISDSYFGIVYSVSFHILQ